MMRTAPEVQLRQGTPLMRALLRLILALMLAVALLWGIELLRRQDPFLRTMTHLPPALQHLELYLERPTLTIRDGTRLVATLQLDALEIERNRVQWRARNLRQATIYDERGNRIGIAQAGELMFNYPARRLHITGNPTLTMYRHPFGTTPLTVQTAHLRWDLRMRRLSADLPTQLRWRDGYGTIQTLAWDLGAGVVELGAGYFRVSSTMLQERAQPKREVEFRYDFAVKHTDHLEVRNLFLRDGDTTATAERANVHERKRYALATGKLRLEDPRIDIEGAKLEVWYGENQKRARLQNQVRLRIKPRKTEPPPEGEPETELEQAKRYPIDATCDEIEYFYRRKVAYIRGNIKAVQQLADGRTRTLTASEAEYDQKNERLILRGKVVVDEPQRIYIETELAIVSLVEGEEKIETPKGAKGYFYEEEEEETPPPNGNPQNPR
ncbi:MAG: hypothetical protein RMK45_04485 [Armatimonadota bacterium]|nr:hypothetical protein [Armatimonadota bacterium]